MSSSYVGEVLEGSAAIGLEGVAQELTRRQGDLVPRQGRDISAVFRECVRQVPGGALADEYVRGFFTDVLLRTPPELGAWGVWEAWGKYQTYLYFKVPRDADPAQPDWVAETTRIFTTLSRDAVADRVCGATGQS